MSNFGLKNAKRNADAVHPPIDYVPVTPSDTAEINPTRAIWVGVGGNVAVQTLDGTNRIIPGIQNGTLLPGQFKQIRATSTTASSISAVY